MTARSPRIATRKTGEQLSEGAERALGMTMRPSNCGEAGRGTVLVPGALYFFTAARISF